MMAPGHYPSEWELPQPTSCDFLSRIKNGRSVSGHFL